MVGERTNVTGSPKFKNMILAGDMEGAVAVALQQVQNGANIIDVNFDEALLDGEKLMTEFLNLLASEPEISRVPIMIDSSKWSVIEAGLKCVQGKCIVNSISMKEGVDNFIAQAKLLRRYGAAVIVMTKRPAMSPSSTPQLTERASTSSIASARSSTDARLADSTRASISSAGPSACPD